MPDPSLRSSSPASEAEMIELCKLAELQTSILSHLPVGISVYDVVSRSEIRLIYINQDSYAISGLSLADILGKRIEEFMPPRDAALGYARFHTCLDSGVPFEVEDSFTLPKGEFYMELTYIPLRNAQGRICRVLVTTANITSRKQRLQDEQQRQAEIIEQQAATLAELSTPLLAISETTVVMPLIGAIDTRRVQHMMDTLLCGVAERRATTVILDITGVLVVDTQVANALIQSALAVKLLGAEAVLTGIRPEVAQTLVQLGVSLQGVITRGTLQDGIAYALYR